MNMNDAKDRAEMESFRSALVKAGAQILDPTNEWEWLRYRLLGKVGIVYLNKKGRISPSGASEAHHKNWRSGRPFNLSKSKERRKIKRARDLATPKLYTDASLYSDTKSGAWAAVLVGQDGKAHEAHGPLKGEISSSTSAEARAAVNAIHHFAAAGLIADRVEVICDNQAVVNKLNKGSASSTCKQTSEALAHLLEITRGRLAISASWIKGHQPIAAIKRDPRIEFNRRCDALAGRHGKRLHKEREQVE